VKDFQTPEKRKHSIEEPESGSTQATSDLKYAESLNDFEEEKEPFGLIISGELNDLLDKEISKVTLQPKTGISTHTTSGLSRKISPLNFYNGETAFMSSSSH